MLLCDMLGVSKLVGKVSEFAKQIECPATHGKNEPAYLTSTDKKEDAKKAYHVQDVDVACLLSTEEEDAKKAAAGKDVLTPLMSTDKKEDAKKADVAEDIDAACKLSTEKEEDEKKAAAGKDVPTYLTSTVKEEGAKKKVRAGEAAADEKLDRIRANDLKQFRLFMYDARKYVYAAGDLPIRAFANWKKVVRLSVYV